MKRKKINRMHLKREGGFTLIEMLTVAAIIGILATMAVASMRGGKLVTYETMCVAAMKHISEAEQLYFSRHMRFTDWQGLIDEGDLIDPGYRRYDDVNDPLDTPIAMLYTIWFPDKRVFSYSTVFSAVAYPIDTDTWKLRTFAVDSDGSILNSRDNTDYFDRIINN